MNMNEMSDTNKKLDFSPKGVKHWLKEHSEIVFTIASALAIGQFILPKVFR